MTVLERHHAFYQNLRDYIAEIREQALLKELKSFRSLLNSRYPLSMLLERENRH